MGYSFILLKQKKDLPKEVFCNKKITNPVYIQVPYSGVVTSLSSNS